MSDTNEYTEIRDKIGASIVRTVVPAVVALLLGWAAKVGLDIDSDLLAGFLTSVILGAYYAVARYLETFVSAKWGWLLGKIGAPLYEAKHSA